MICDVIVVHIICKGISSVLQKILALHIFVPSNVFDSVLCLTPAGPSVSKDVYSAMFFTMLVFWNIGAKVNLQVNTIAYCLRQYVSLSILLSYILNKLQNDVFQTRKTPSNVRCCCSHDFYVFCVVHAALPCLSLESSILFVSCLLNLPFIRYAIQFEGLPQARHG